MKNEYKYKIKAVSEIDGKIYSMYRQLHGDIDNLGNMSKITEKQLQDLGKVTHICCSVPCIDFSTAGRNQGCICVCNTCKKQFNPLMIQDWDNTCIYCNSNDIQRTTATLFSDLLRIVEHKRPYFIISENVKTLRHTQTFQMLKEQLQLLHYNIYYKILNAKDYGIPQNRERLFIVAIRRDKDTLHNFQFTQHQIHNNIQDYLLSDNAVPVQYYLQSNVNVGGIEDTAYTLLCDNNTRRYDNKRTNIINCKNGCQRKLTPQEYVRLQGYSDKEYAKISNNADYLIYRAIGNSIPVSVLLSVYADIFVYDSSLFQSLKVLSLCSGIGAYEAALSRLYRIIDICDGDTAKVQQVVKSLLRQKQYILF